MAIFGDSLDTSWDDSLGRDRPLAVKANYGPFLICYRLTGASLESEDLDAGLVGARVKASSYE